MKKRILLFVAVIILLFLCPCAVFAWTKTGTFYFTDGSYPDVSSAVSDASAGDTVTIPAGTFDWGQNTLTIGKKIILKGDGINTTTIISSNSTMISINKADAAGIRITGFKVNKVSGVAVSIEAVIPGFRIDHIYFDYTTTQTAINIIWGSKTVNIQGLIDNCIFEFGYIKIHGAQNSRYGFEVMSDDRDLGGPTALYVEDCVANEWADGGASPKNFLDTCCGMGYVSRYNEIHGIYHEAHGIQGNYNGRSTKKVEIYRNTLDGGYSSMDEYAFQWQPTNLRVASAMLWQNEVHNYGRNGFYLSEYRIGQPEGDLGQCNGSNEHDSNYLSNGWLCFDQPGTGADKSLRTASNPYPDQYQELVYVFGNTVNSAPYNVVHSVNETYFKADRDYFVQGGTIGVSSGPLADMPTTCIEGQGYWATDQGDWNHATTGPWAGVQGVLYTCSVTGFTGDGDSGTWEVHYTPYTYPHPLRSISETDTACGTADTDLSGDVSSTELKSLIIRWAAGSTTIRDLMKGISEWKNGCG
jgi:hypothetical protein